MSRVRPIRRFPPPWRVLRRASAFVVVDAEGAPVAYVYIQVAPTAPSGSMDEEAARRVAVNIARLPDLLGAGGERAARGR
jgi:hypothetical protein